MSRTQLLSRAIALAVTAHGANIGEDGTPYILHPLRLMLRAKGEDEQVVAVLHDTIEDTALTLATLREEGFPEDLLAAIDAVTHREGETYIDFIERIALNPLAVRVKLLDLEDNMDVMRLATIGELELARLAKYHHAYWRLRSLGSVTR